MCKRMAYMRLVLLLVVAVQHSGIAIGEQASGQPFITSVSYLFEAFSPYALLRFFEFSDKGWHISEHCLKDMYNYMEGLRREALWAVKLYDASGYYGGGIFAGGIAAHVRMQNAHACESLQEQHERIAWRLPRKWFWNATVVPFPVHIIMAHYQLELLHEEDIYRVHRVQQLICFPQTCSSMEDLLQILELYGLPPSHVVRNGSYLSHRIVTADYNAFDDMHFYLLITFFCGSFCLYAAVHLVRVYLTLCNRTANNPSGWSTMEGAGGVGLAQSPSNGIALGMLQMFKEKPPTPVLNGSQNVPLSGTQNFPLKQLPVLPPIVKRSRVEVLENLLDACSLQSVLYTLLLSDDAPQHGLLVLFTSLMIYAHLAAELTFMRNAEDQSFVVRNASYLIDIYFFMHATKLAQQFGKPVNKPKEKHNVCDQLRHVLKILLKKLLYLAPSYMFCLYAEHLIGKHFHHNVALELPMHNYRNCHEHKLSNVLYLDTFFPLRERVYICFMGSLLGNLFTNSLTLQCMPWTWFISLEVQFFIIACVILLLAGIHKHYAAIIGFAIFGVSLLAASLWELQPRDIWSTDWDVTQFYLVYENAMQRVPAYLLGLCLGHLLRKNSNVKLNAVVLISGWTVCLVVVGISIWGFNWLLAHVGALTHAFLNTLMHVLFCLVLFWLLLTSLCQYGGWLYELLCFRYSHTLEQLSPICLLISPTLIRLLIFTADAPIQASQAHILLLAIGCWLFTYLAAFLLYVALDGPLQAFIAEMLSQH